MEIPKLPSQPSYDGEYEFAAKSLSQKKKKLFAAKSSYRQLEQYSGEDASPCRGCRSLLMVWVPGGEVPWGAGPVEDALIY